MARRHVVRLARSLLFLASTVLLASVSNGAQIGTVASEKKISETSGGFEGALDAEDFLGTAVAFLGDVDGDGVGDVAVSATGDDDGGTLQGAVWILFMNSDGTVSAEQKISATEGDFGGVLNRDAFGRALASLGDLNGDGTPDLAVGATEDSVSALSQGAVWILFLNPDGTVASEQKIGAMTGGFGGTLVAFARFGTALARLGDIDGDGTTDLAVTASGDDDGGEGQGAVWILSLNPDGTVAAERKISELSGGFGGPLDIGDFFGTSVASLGDLDGDGTSDLAVGVSSDDDGGPERGAIWILFLNPDGTVAAEQKISALSGGFGGSLESADFFGRSLASLGDLVGDGTSVLAVGATGDDDGAPEQGATWILFLNPDGTVASEQKISATVGGFGGDLDPTDLFSASLASLGDLDGDGLVELAVGAPRDDDGGNAQGAVWLLSLLDCVRLDFETEDDFATALTNGQDISTPPEFGSLVALMSSGPNAGAALFDSTPGGPNDPSQDRDLLVGSGKVLMLQTNANTTQTVSGIFDRPNDDEDGGTLSFLFTAPVEPVHVDLVDIDSGSDEACLLILTDKGGRVRVYTIPPGWTGDLLVDGVGQRTLHLDSPAPQPGFAAVATAVQDANFAADRVVSLTLQLGSSGALDNLCWRPHAPGLRPRPGARPRSKSDVPAGVR